MENVEITAAISADKKTKLLTGAEDVIHGNLLSRHGCDLHQTHLANQLAFIRINRAKKHIPQSVLRFCTGGRHRQNESTDDDAEKTHPGNHQLPR
jgi:hypothetical protein